MPHPDGSSRITELAPETYNVVKGDTLFSICWRYGLDQKTVMANNGIANPNKIYIGQTLYLGGTGSATGSAAYPDAIYAGNISTSKPSKRYKKKPRKTSASVTRYANWVWPLKGTIVRRFSAGNVGANGIRIAGKANQTVNAAESGTVAYRGSGLKGYGTVVIIKHKNGLLSAYGFLSKTFVREGQKVKRRQKIGTVGYSPDKRLMLHFEVRRNGKPVNPLGYIGSSYHF